MRNRIGAGAAKSPPGRLRIVAGKWRSRRLTVADVPGLRPTPHRVRETLFNWLQPITEGARCLDLFAGSGALGFEALSRGASGVIFVDADATAVRVLRENAERLRASGATIIHGDARLELARLPPGSVDIAFLDPPFSEDSTADLCRLLAEHRTLAAGARVYLEEDRNRPEARLPAGWTILRSRTAGDVRYSLAAAGE